MELAVGLSRRLGAPAGILRAFRHQDEPVSNYDLFARAWDEFPELKVRPKDEWAGRNLLAIQSIERWEIGVCVQGIIVGGACITEEQWDSHVGPCMSVCAQYVLPEYRNKGISPLLMREAVRITKASNLKVIAYTHRVGDWRYEVIYREIKNEIKSLRA